jgi:hypothetical protein
LPWSLSGRARGWTTAAELLEAADIDMYRNKRERKARAAA